MQRRIVIHDELYKKLEQLSKVKYVSITCIIRIACSEYLKKEEKQCNMKASRKE